MLVDRDRPLYYILKGHEPVPVPNVLAFTRAFDSQNRVVREEVLPNGKRVITEFLGIDHNHAMEGDPLLFETRVFADREMLLCERCSTWEEAENQHAQVVEEAR